jgi:hypothetical protein
MSDTIRNNVKNLTRLLLELNFIDVKSRQQYSPLGFNSILLWLIF